MLHILPNTLKCIHGPFQIRVLIYEFFLLDIRLLHALSSFPPLSPPQLDKIVVASPVTSVSSGGTDLSRWPSGPRRRLQVPFLFGGREFEPRFRYLQSEMASEMDTFCWIVDVFALGSPTHNLTGLYNLTFFLLHKLVLNVRKVESNMAAFCKDILSGPRPLFYLVLVLFYFLLIDY